MLVLSRPSWGGPLTGHNLALSRDLALLRMTENSTLREASGWWALLCVVGEQKGHWAHTLGTMKFRDGRALESSFYPTILTREEGRDRVRFTCRSPEPSLEQVFMNICTQDGPAPSFHNRHSDAETGAWPGMKGHSDPARARTQGTQSTVWGSHLAPLLPR